MRLAVKPTRMELLGLRKRLKLARRGHELLKQRRDELMRRFLGVIKDSKVHREKVEKLLDASYKTAAAARASMEEGEFGNSLIIEKSSFVDITVKNVGGIWLPRISLSEPPKPAYGLAGTPGRLDAAVSGMRSLLPELIKLAEIEHTIRALASEIALTRRRVNALEHIMIPRLEETIRYIEMKMDENERAEFSVRMKIKEIVEKSAGRSIQF
ncbi:MAG: V-type ATP synthase subunit D [Firmicutes bacterium HGW-Firmicutes-8]|nr:MAG: V-type ATP synthase subunit D [Firmicutes bacterium HGW-Firmicutes-8]